MNSICFKILSSINFIASNGAGPATDEGTGSWLSQASVDVFSFLINLLSSIWSFLGKSIMTLVYLVVKFALNIVDFLQFFVGKLIGLSTWGSNSVADTSFENTDIIFKFLSSPTVRKVFIAILVLSIVLLILFTIIAIIRQQYLSTIDEKQTNGIGLFVKRVGKSLVLFLTVPVMVVFGILGSNAILSGISSAFKLGSGITLGGQVFVASSYEANRYRSYAKADVRVPMYYRNAVDVTELNSNISDYCVMSYREAEIEYDGDDGNTKAMQVMQPYLLVTRSYDSFTGLFVSIDYDAGEDQETNYHKPNEKFIFKACEFLLCEQGFSGGKYKLYLNGNGTSYESAGEDGNWQYIRHDIINLNGKKYLNGCEIKGSGENSYIEIDYSEKDNKISSIGSDEDVKNAYTSWNYNDKFANVNLSFNATRNKETKNIGGVSCYVNSNNSTYLEYENFTPLQNEYFVMADVIDFAIESGKQLYFLPIKYAGNSFENALDGKELVLNDTEKAYIKKSSDTGIGFYVNYYDETDFYKYSSADDERDGAVYVVCTSTTQGFIPLTQGNSAFQSSYLSKNYKGMIVARGLLDDSSSSFLSEMFTTYCPTFIKNVSTLSNSNLQYYSGLQIKENKITNGTSVIKRLPGGTAENTLENKVSVQMKAYAEQGNTLTDKNKNFTVDFYVQTETNTMLYDIEGVAYKDVYYDCVFYGKTGSGTTNSALFKAVIIETVKKEGDLFVSQYYTIKEYLFADENWTQTYTAAASQNASATLSGGAVVVNEGGYLYFCRSELNRNIIGPLDLNFSLVNFRAHWALFHGGSSSVDRGVVAYRLQNGSFMLDYNFNESTGIAMGYIYDAIDLNIIVLVFCTIMLFQILIKTVYGLINRIYEIVLLFLIMPGFVSMIPLDDGAKFTKWKEMLIKKVLATYGITIGINLFFILAPIIKTATQIFSSADIPVVLRHVPLFSDAVFLNRIVYLLFLLVALTLLQSAPAIIAELLGAGEVMKEGGAVKKNVKDMVDDVRDTVSGQKAKKYMKDFKENAMGFLPGSEFYGDKLSNAASNLRNKISNRFARSPINLEAPTDDAAERERLEREFDEAHKGELGPEDGGAAPPPSDTPPPDDAGGDGAAEEPPSDTPPSGDAGDESMTLDSEIESAQAENDKKQSDLTYFKDQESDAQHAYDTKYQSIFEEEKETLLKQRNAKNPNRTKKKDLYQSEKSEIDEIVKKKMGGTEEGNNLSLAKELTATAQEEADNSQLKLDVLNEEKTLRNATLKKRTQTRKDEEERVSTSQEKVDNLTDKKNNASRTSTSEGQSTGAIEAEVSSLESALRKLQAETYDMRKAAYVKKGLAAVAAPSSESRQKARNSFGARLRAGRIDHSARNSASMGSGISERIKNRKKEQVKGKKHDDMRVSKEKEHKPKVEGTSAERNKSNWIARREKLENEGAKLNVFEKLSSLSPEKRKQKVAEKTTRKIQEAQNKESKYQTKIDSRQAGIERRTERMAKVVSAAATVRNKAQDVYGTAKNKVVEKTNQVKNYVGDKYNAGKSWVKDKYAGGTSWVKDKYNSAKDAVTGKAKEVGKKIQQTKVYQGAEKVAKTVGSGVAKATSKVAKNIGKGIDKTVDFIDKIPKAINNYKENIENASAAGVQQAKQNVQAKIQETQDKSEDQRTLREKDMLRSESKGNQIGHTKEVKTQSRAQLKKIWSSKSSSEIENVKQEYKDSSLNEAYRKEKENYQTYVDKEHVGTSSENQAKTTAKKMNMSRSGNFNAGRRRGVYKTDEKLRKNKNDSDS